MAKELATLAEDTAQGARHGEHELAVGKVVTDGVCYPVADAADALLMAGGAEVAGFAGEGEESFVAAIRALEPGEAGGEVAAAEEGLNGSGCGGAERSEGFAVVFFVTSEEVVPAVVNELPEGGGAGTAGLVDGRHKNAF